MIEYAFNKKTTKKKKQAFNNNTKTTRKKSRLLKTRLMESNEWEENKSKKISIVQNLVIKCEQSKNKMLRNISQLYKAY